MNTKYLAIILAIIIIVASSVGYLAYTGALNANPKAPNSPTPTPTASPAKNTPTPTATTSVSPSPSPVVTTSPTPTPTPTPTPATLTVFIASSLTNVVANMTAAFDKQYNCNIVVNSGSSSTLEQQIVAGSPCDVFMSADTKWT
ncbi:MAG: substrate-binding domain-containing protein, partial [Candidatus Bathyarchaeia archaeon]